jgi:hypothetical protein
MRRTAFGLMVVSGFLAAAVPTVAHHAFASEFDANRPVKIEGTVTKMDWVNPHSWLYVDVKGADGTIENWAVEAGAPNAMFRRGFRRDSLPVGTYVLVDGWMAKNKARTMNGRNIKLMNGQTLFVGSSGTGAPTEIDQNQLK